MTEPLQSPLLSAPVDDEYRVLALVLLVPTDGDGDDGDNLKTLLGRLRPGLRPGLFVGCPRCSMTILPKGGASLFLTLRPVERDRSLLRLRLREFLVRADMTVKSSGPTPPSSRGMRPLLFEPSLPLLPLPDGNDFFSFQLLKPLLSALPPPTLWRKEEETSFCVSCRPTLRPRPVVAGPRLVERDRDVRKVLAPMLLTMVEDRPRRLPATDGSMTLMGWMDVFRYIRRSSCCRFSEGSGLGRGCDTS